MVLVGHSYAGAVISQAAAEDPNVKALVCIAAFIPTKGESAGELTGTFPGSALASALIKVPFPLDNGGTGTDLYIKPDKFRAQFAADVPRAQTDLMAVTQRPVAASTLDDKATEEAWKTIPSWDVITTQDKAIPPAAQRFMAKRAGAHSVEVDASHAVSVYRPEAVSKLVNRGQPRPYADTPPRVSCGCEHGCEQVAAPSPRDSHRRPNPSERARGDGCKVVIGSVITT